MLARESDLLFFSFPQNAGRARLYFCFPADQRSRFAGRDGARRFLDQSRLHCLTEIDAWGAARPSGPCATFTAEDSRASAPLAEGVVLIGDAAGYENPLQGQGLSMALRDVRDVSDALLAGSHARYAFEDYTAARATRQRLANLGVALEVWANDGFSEQDPGQRAARSDHNRTRAESFMTGYPQVPWVSAE